MISKFVETVKNQVSFHTFSEQNVDNVSKRKKQTYLKHRFLEIQRYLEDLSVLLLEHQIDDIDQLRSELDSKHNTHSEEVVYDLSQSPDITPEDLKGLSPEEIEKLEIPKADNQEFQIIKFINDIGGTATVRKVMLGLRAITGEIPEKHFINNKMYRMTKKDNPVLFASEMGQGYYTTINPNNENSDQDELNGFLDLIASHEQDSQ